VISEAAEKLLHRLQTEWNHRAQTTGCLGLVNGDMEIWYDGGNTEGAKEPRLVRARLQCCAEVAIRFRNGSSSKAVKEPKDRDRMVKRAGGGVSLVSSPGLSSFRSFGLKGPLSGQVGCDGFLPLPRKYIALAVYRAGSAVQAN